MAIVITWPTLSPLPQRDSNSNLITASFLFQKVNQHCLGVVTRASGSTITDPSNFLNWYMPYNIHSRKEGRAVNSTSHESRDNWHISAKAHSPFNHMMRPSGQVYYIWDDVQDTRVVCILYRSNQRFLARSRPFTMDKPCWGQLSISCQENGSYTWDLRYQGPGDVINVLGWAEVGHCLEDRFYRCEHDWLRCSWSRSLSLPSSFSVLLPLVSSWQSCYNDSFRGNRGTFERHLRTAHATSRQKRRLV